MHVLRRICPPLVLRPGSAEIHIPFPGRSYGTSLACGGLTTRVGAHLGRIFSCPPATVSGQLGMFFFFFTLPPFYCRTYPSISEQTNLVILCRHGGKCLVLTCGTSRSASRRARMASPSSAPSGMSFGPRLLWPCPRLPLLPGACVICPRGFVACDPHTCHRPSTA